MSEDIDGVQGWRCVYLIGEPGCGKSTLLMRALALSADLKIGPQIDRPFRYHQLCAKLDVKGTPVHIIDPGRVLLGRYDAEAAPYYGTDRLAMSVQPLVLRHCAGLRPSLVLGEGDRLGNQRFFDAMQELHYELIVVLVTADNASERRKEREIIPQSEVWLKGRRTKIANLERYVSETIDNSDDLNDAAMKLLSLIYH